MTKNKKHVEDKLTPIVDETLSASEKLSATTEQVLRTLELTDPQAEARKFNIVSSFAAGLGTATTLFSTLHQAYSNEAWLTPENLAEEARTLYKQGKKKNEIETLLKREAVLRTITPGITGSAALSGFLITLSIIFPPLAVFTLPLAIGVGAIGMASTAYFTNKNYQRVTHAIKQDKITDNLPVQPSTPSAHTETIHNTKQVLFGINVASLATTLASFGKLLLPAIGTIAGVALSGLGIL